MTHLWSDSYGSTGEQVPTSLAVDASGNIALVGSFDGLLDFGGGALFGTRFFYAKFDAAGNHLWSASNGSTFDRATDVAFDSAGNVIITGTYQGTIDFGGGTIFTSGLKNVFLAKLDPAGNHIWSYGFGDSTHQDGGAVAVDDSDNIIVVGSFEGTMDFGGGALTSGGSQDVYLAKFTSAGGHLWSQSFGGPFFHFGQDVAADGSGNVIITGENGGTIDFGGGPLSVTGAGDAFVARFDASGTHQWSYDFGGPSGGSERGLGVAADNSGNVIATGTFDDDVDLGGGLMATAGDDDVYLVKFDAAGNHLWSDSFGGPGNETMRGGKTVTTDASGNVVLTGAFMESIDFGGGVLTANTFSDVFIAEIDTAGNHLWSNRYGGESHQLSEAVAVTTTGDIVVTGRFVNDIDFGGGLLTSAGGKDIFLAKLGDVASGTEPVASPGFALEQNHPNPFNPTTSITLRLDHEGPTQLIVYDASGSHIRTLADGPLSPGPHVFEWDGRNDSGQLVTSGVYFIRASAGQRTVTSKAVLLK
jgi:hypothetical protein